MLCYSLLRATKSCDALHTVLSKSFPTHKQTWYTSTTSLIPFSTQITSEAPSRLGAFFPANNQLKAAVIWSSNQQNQQQIDNHLLPLLQYLGGFHFVGDLFLSHIEFYKPGHMARFEVTRNKMKGGIVMSWLEISISVL